MKELITAAASLMILMTFVLQFAAHIELRPGRIPVYKQVLGFGFPYGQMVEIYYIRALACNH